LRRRAHIAADPRATAYLAGVECALDRLLLAGRLDDARAIAGWKPPRLAIGGAISSSAD
jgi:poly(A) polymerase